MKRAIQGLLQKSVAGIPKSVYILAVLAYLTAAQAQQTLHLNTAVEEPLTNEAHDGFIDEVVKEALRRIGYSLSIENLPAERGLRAANSGKIDGEIARIKGIDIIYKNLIRVPEKVIDMSFVAFSKHPLDLKNGWNSLKNRNVAYITGWKIFENNVPESAETSSTEDSMQLFYLLEKGRTDLILYNQMGGLFMINKLHLNGISLVTPAFATKDMFIYLNEKHKKIAPALSRSLAAMKKDGSYDALRNKHLFLE